MTTDTKMTFDDLLCELNDNIDTTRWTDLPDGRKIRARIEPDDAISIDDFDCYGKITPVIWTAWSLGQHEPRPAEYDGCSEKISTRYGEYWWQPPLFDIDDVRRWHSDKEFRRALRQDVLDVLEFGFHMIVVEIGDGTDAYGRPIICDAASLGGIAPCGSDMRFEIADTIAGLESDLNLESN